MTTASIRTECLDENAALALVDGALAPPARARVERHLESCDGCRELVAELARGFEDDAPPSPDTERLPYAAVASVVHGGRYRVEAEIGSGSAGTVYRARDERTREIVALKIVTDPALAHRFEREAAALARLEHPAIVRYIAHGATEGGMYLAMEWLEGEELEARLRRGALGWEAARVLALRLTEALAQAHAVGLVHRDLSPRNVFLPGGRLEAAKLLDFGLVRLPDGQTLERTASQAILGTPYYMSPEQVRDPKRVDARSDLFGLGVLLYEMTCGRRPFDGTDLFTLWVNIVDASPPDLGTLAPGTPPAFLAIVDALLAKDPAARPASASFVHRALATMEVSFAPTAPLMRPIESPQRRSAPMTPAPLAQLQPLVQVQPPVPLPGAMTLPAGHVPSAPPPWSPPGAVTAPPRAPPSAPGAGLFMAAGAGIMSLVAAAIVLAYLATHRTPSTVDGAVAPTASPTKKEEAKKTDAKEDEPPKKKEQDAPKEGAITTVTPAPRPVTKPHSLTCNNGTMSERGGSYAPDDSSFIAVLANGGCELVLEDCTITGEAALNVNGGSKVTLRRCHVTGSVTVVSPTSTLIAERTHLPHVNNNGGHVVVQ